MTASSGDYFDIVNSGKNWPNPDVTSNSNQVLERIDDLWHASVNGRGQYLSASNPDDVVDALKTALNETKNDDYNSSAAATSTLEPVTGDKSAFVAQYTTGYWYGDLKSKYIDTTDGSLEPTVLWSASPGSGKKPEVTPTRARSIRSARPAPTTLKEFRSKNTDGTPNTSLDWEKAAGLVQRRPVVAVRSWDATRRAPMTR